jgi:hypothetical protein
MVAQRQTTLRVVCCRITLYGIKRAACGGAAWLSCRFVYGPRGPIPLAARGLAAVLARVGPAGAVV